MADLVDRAFKLFLGRITPPESQLAAAQTGHSNLRRRLESDGYFGRLIETTFLNGSYARHTVIRPIKDVDIVVAVFAEWLEVEPAKAMESLRRKLSQWYDGWRTRRRRRAVQVQLSRINLDVLLAVAPDGDSKPMFIPDRDQRCWIRTHPRRQLELAESLGRGTNGNYPRLVRLAKAWSSNRIALSARPRSFLLECAVYHVVSNQPHLFGDDVQEGFVTLLECLRDWDFGRSDVLTWNPVVPDPALSDVNVADRWTSECADAFRLGLELALRRCAAADHARWQESAVARWSEVFGGSFPRPFGAVQRNWA